MQHAYGPILLMTVVLLGFGCHPEKDAAADNAPPSQVATLTEADDGSTQTLAVGASVAIKLEGSPSTGFQWTVDEITGAADVVTITGPEYKPDDPDGPPGSGGAYTTMLKAAKAGRVTVAPVYKRPWEEDTPPARTFTVTVVVE